MQPPTAMMYIVGKQEASVKLYALPSTTYLPKAVKAQLFEGKAIFGWWFPTCAHGPPIENYTQRTQIIFEWS